MNISPQEAIVLSGPRRDELAGLLGGLIAWLTFGDRDAHRDLARHLKADAAINGGPLNGSAHETLSTLTDLVDAYSVLLQRDEPGGGL